MRAQSNTPPPQPFAWAIANVFPETLRPPSCRTRWLNHRSTMKITLSLCFALLALAPAQAQIFRPEALKGAVLGGIAGGIIGHNSGDLRHNGWKGAAIGSAAGLVIGQAIGDSRAHRNYVRPHSYRGYGGYSGYVYRSSPAVRIRTDYRRGYYGPRYFGQFGHHRGVRPHYRLGHRGFGWHLSHPPYASPLGYHSAYRYGYPEIEYGDYVYATPARRVLSAHPASIAPVQVAPLQAAQPAPQQITIINNYYNSASPMSSANGLFGR